MKRSALSLLLLVVTAAGPAIADDAPYQFVIAKILSDQGALDEAAEAFAAAAESEPHDPYVHVEFSRLLATRAESRGSVQERLEDLRVAQVQGEAAAKLAPESTDVLRQVVDVNLKLARFGSNPEALNRAREALEEIRRLEPYDAQSMVTLGQVYLSLQQPTQAAEVFKEAVSYTPSNQILYSLLVESQLRSGQDAEAEEALGKLLLLNPNAVEARQTLSDLQRRRGDLLASVETLESAPQEVRSLSELRRRLAELLFFVGRYEDADTEVEALLTREPKNPAYIYLKARILEAQGESQAAVEQLEDLYRQEPENVELAANLAQMLALSGRLGEARSLYQSVIDRVERGEHSDADRLALEAQARFGLASVAFEEGDWPAVEAAALPLTQDSSREWQVRGALLVSEAMLRQERVTDALRLLDRVAVGQGMGTSLLAGKRVEILLRSDDERKARKLMRNLVRQGEIASALEAVRSYQRLGLFQESLESVEELARKIDAETSDDSPGLEVYYLLGTALERVGERGRAAEAFERLLAKEPDFAPALNYLGYMWAEHGENLRRALELTQRAVEIDPDNGAYVDSLGWAHYQLRNYEQAREHLERAVKLTPGDSVVLEHLGDVYLALGIRDKARELYQQALELEGENAAQIRRKLGELHPD